MLISIGSPPPAQDLVGLLLECHQRIRTFIALAQSLGRGGDHSDAEVIDACERCQRYFSSALPLHVEDEERTLRPRLQGTGGGVAAALQTMEAQHQEHAPLLIELLDALRAVRGAPADPQPRPRLAAVAYGLASQLAEHLALEEEVIFPALRALPADVQATAVEELRARRRSV